MSEGLNESTGEHRIIGPIPNGHDPSEYDRFRRRVLWLMPSGLYVVGSCGEPRDHGRERNLMTCNWCQQVAMEPKLLAVSIESGAVTARLVRAGGVFSVNIVKRSDRSVVRRFVKPVTDAEEDSHGHVVSMGGQETWEAPSGAPLLRNAAAWVDCAVRREVPLGSHVLFVGEVTMVGTGDDAETEAGVLRMEDTRMNYGG